MKIKDYERLKLINYEELTKASDSIGNCIGVLADLEMFLPLEYKRRYKKTYKFLEDLYDEIDRIFIEIADLN